MTTKSTKRTAEKPAQAPPKKAATKRAQGRPKKPEGEKLEQFSIRLPPKLKFGLELLARAQHRSLSQAIEWALQVGLNNYEVGYVGGDSMESIGTIVERAWSAREGYGRLKAIYDTAAMLLDFDDLKACELIEKSHEADIVRESIPVDIDMEKQPEKFMEAMRDTQKQERENAQVFDTFCELFWPAIRAAASDRANAGQSTQGVSVLQLLGLRQYFLGADTMQLLRHITNALAGQTPKTTDDVTLMLTSLQREKEQSREAQLDEYFATKGKKGEA
ncbi:MAG: hypothetical protein WA961_04440 [Rhodanobacter sp.]